MNKSILSGYLTDNVKIKTTPSGKTFGTFTLAVNKRQKNEAIFIPIVTWDAVAQSCSKYLKKSSKVLVEGELNVRSYDDTEGIQRWVTEIVANTVEFMDRKPKDDDRVIERDEPHVSPPNIENEELVI